MRYFDEPKNPRRPLILGIIASASNSGTASAVFANLVMTAFKNGDVGWSEDIPPSLF